MAAQASTCSRCDPSAPAEGLSPPGTLYRRLPTAHALGRLTAALGSAVSRRGELALVSVASGLDEVLGRVEAALTSAELSEARAFFAPEADPDPLARAMGAEPVATLRARLAGGWLGRLLDERRVVAMLQPIFAAETGALFAFESLARGEEGGALVPPDRLFAVARATGLLARLDVACRRAAVEAALSRPGTHGIFVNFNPSSVYDPRFCLRRTIATVRETGVDPGRIVFEVVESERIDDVPHVRAVLDAYRAEGFRVALDDLGSGYASLRLLEELRPDYVKIDMELVRGVHANGWKAAFMGKLLEAARAVDVQTVAEGIEVPEELAWVRDHGADYVQGYLLGRPGRAEQVLSRVAPAAPQAARLPPPRPRGLPLEGAARVHLDLIDLSPTDHNVPLDGIPQALVRGGAAPG